MKTRIPDPEESVRRMFRAKPSMNAIVVQLLVDLLRINCECNKIPNRNPEKILQIVNHIFYMRRQGSGKDRQPVAVYTDNLSLTQKRWSRRGLPLFNES